MVSRYSSGQLLLKKPQEGNRQNFGDRETLVSRGKRTRREALLGKTRSSAMGVTTLDRSPDQSPGVEAYIHALATNGNQERSPPWGDKIEWQVGGWGTTIAYKEMYRNKCYLYNIIVITV